MMFTCSALRCSVFEGSAISGTSGDSGAGDPTAPQGIPDAVLYITVDDQALSDVLRNLEHPADLPLDAPRDIRPSGGREIQPPPGPPSPRLQEGGGAGPVLVPRGEGRGIGRGETPPPPERAP